MIQLPKDCFCSDLKVFPASWKSPKSPIKKKWYIFYRFFDPSFKKQFPHGKLVIIKGMNRLKTRQERKESTEFLHKLEMENLLNGFNPITRYSPPPLAPAPPSLPQLTGIDPDTRFIDALHQANKSRSFQNTIRHDMKTVLKYVEQAIKALQLEDLPIKNVSRKHIKLILEQCKLIKSHWSANTYNVYRSHLSILFNELMEMEAIETNPVRDIKKQKIIRAIRRILTPEECNRIDSYLKNHDLKLWVFINIFFHSGSRTTEILRVQGEHVDLKNQKVKYLLLKGQQYQWVSRTIKDVALPFWKMAMKDCKSKDFVFSRGLKPGATSILREQITTRWKAVVKDHLGIDCDFYSLKHLNTDQTSALLDIHAAAAQNSHRSTDITRIYAVNEQERMHEKLKKVTNSFASKNEED